MRRTQLLRQVIWKTTLVEGLFHADNALCSASKSIERYSMIIQLLMKKLRKGLNT